MPPLIKNGDLFNPDICFDPTQGKLSITGSFIPLNEDEFLGDMVEWLCKAGATRHTITNIEIDLKYLNGKSVRALHEILGCVKKQACGEHALLVSWHIPKSADDMRDLSEFLMSKHELPYRISLN